MKRVTLVRHGHAEPQAEGGDFFRSLDDRGRAEAARSATAIATACGAPDRMAASAAMRTRETALILREHWASIPASALPLVFERKLYHADWTVLLQTLQDTASSINHLLLVGHNPGISELALRWSSGFAEHAVFRGFAPAGWCTATFDIDDWTALSSPVEARFEPTPPG